MPSHCGNTKMTCTGFPASRDEDLEGRRPTRRGAQPRAERALGPHRASSAPRLLAAARGRAPASGTSRPDCRTRRYDQQLEAALAFGRRGAGGRGGDTRLGPAGRGAAAGGGAAGLGVHSAEEVPSSPRRPPQPRRTGPPQPRRAGPRCRPDPGATTRGQGARGGRESLRSRSCSDAGSRGGGGTTRSSCSSSSTWSPCESVTPAPN